MSLSPVRLSPVEILHDAFRATLNYHGKYAFAPQLLRDAERHLKGETISDPGRHVWDFFFGDVGVVHHTCMDQPRLFCAACAGVGYITEAEWKEWKALRPRKAVGMVY